MSELLTQPAAILAGVAVAAGVGAYFAMAPGGKKEEAKAVKKKGVELPKKLKKKKEKEETGEVVTKPSPVVSEPVQEKEELDLNQFVGDFPDTDDEEAARAEANRKRNAKKKAAKKKKAAEDDQPKSKKGGAADLISKLDNGSTSTKKEKKGAAAAAASEVPQDADPTANEDGWETVAYRKRGSKANLTSS